MISSGNATEISAPGAAPAAAGSVGRRIAALDGLRGVAIALVLGFHLIAMAPAPGTGAVVALRLLFIRGGAGVDLFFVLSGFLIGGILLEHARTANFMRVFYARRISRIFPLYALLLLTFVVARQVLGPSFPEGPTYFAATIPGWSYPLFLQNIQMAARHAMGATWLVATWSLAVEEQYYLAMPWLARSVTRRALAIGCGAIVVGAPLLRLALAFQARNPFGALYLTVSRLDGLAAGMLIALVVRNARSLAWVQSQRRKLGAATLLFIGASIAASYAKEKSLAEELVYGPTFFALGFGLTLLHIVTAEGWLARALARRPIVWLGRVSYLVYLFHLPVQYFLHGWLRGSRLENTSVPAMLTTALGLAITLGLAAVSWRYFESRLLGLGRRLQYSNP